MVKLLIAIAAALSLVVGCDGGTADRPPPDTTTDTLSPTDTGITRGPTARANSLASLPAPDTVITSGVDSVRRQDSLFITPWKSTTVSFVTVETGMPELVLMGIPFGPYGLLNEPRAVEPFTASLNYSSPTTIVSLIETARAKRHKLVLAMTACCRKQYTEKTGRLDFAEWKKRQDQHNTPAIRAAIIKGVEDGTIVGNKLLDEPENTKWGTMPDGTTRVTKATIDSMAIYTRAIFPTLPLGVAHGSGGYRWRTDQTYKELDWAKYQYNGRVSGPDFKAGDVVGWRRAVLAQAKKDNVVPAYSINVLGGPRLPGCPVPATGGPGWGWPEQKNCLMTAEQVRTFGLALGPHACVFTMWTYDPAFMSNPANQQALRDVAAALSNVPRVPCKKSS